MQNLPVGSNTAGDDVSKDEIYAIGSMNISAAAVRPDFMFAGHYCRRTAAVWAGHAAASRAVCFFCSDQHHVLRCGYLVCLLNVT